MGFETPSDRFAARSRRFAASLGRFLRLEPMDASGLLRPIWVFALVVYGFHLIGWLLTIPSYLTSPFARDYWVWWRFIKPLLVAPFEPLLWLMIVRLVLEVCGRALRERPAGGQDSPP